ncbi:hypothetical protein Golax_000412 [Gossypium laxum]|uniref:Uncharacterized protein n=1 Tax=Gossypium laxum TaxID=34288 RepID=A0A7J9AVK0_9ROSI|nr:hypothetical protein [Gossypium laxum]
MVLKHLLLVKAISYRNQLRWYCPSL